MRWHGSEPSGQADALREDMVVDTFTPGVDAVILSDADHERCSGVIERGGREVRGSSA
jgi:hypothetical protein